MIDVQIITTVAIISQYVNYQTNMFYTLNLHSVICQIHFNKITLKLKIHEIELQSARCERGKDKELYYKVGSAMNKTH